ncbi:hypothetical protein [Nodosilinea sp. E11]|uniref:hypothetical protein n=1 Tax=Nodosilinea sp. E11 TaxID=3037479 RepID=UPI0029349D4B|nr:hypothetical protein [Nodosilinea sp. E11]WOD37903.1 hypothetical protein RRF56_16955 [Nodosilinea sp. E11]
MILSDREQLACLETLAGVAKLKGMPTPREFEAFLAAIAPFTPLPVGVTLESLLGDTRPIEHWLPQIQTPEGQQQVYRGAYGIVRSKGINPQETAVLRQLRSAFGLSPELAAALARQPLRANLSGGSITSALAGMAALIGREGDVRRLIFDYALGAAIAGLVPLRGGGSLEIKFLVVLGLILKMSWDIRNLWGRPRGQDLLAIAGNLFGFWAAVVVGFLAWGTVVGLGVVVPYVGAFAPAAGFATATWIAGQAINQFYTSAKRPDPVALKRAFPNLQAIAQSSPAAIPETLSDIPPIANPSQEHHHG